MGLIHNPKLILFDEPLAGVDAKGSDRIINIINNNIANTECGVLIVEHRNTVKELFTRKVNIELGKIKS
jgi:ABC-type Mn2+/Zn2+ transport system ATPase subunit